MKQVSQSTFDSIVREAIDDFALSPSEAVIDAKEQLSKAGVTDFSNIQTTATPQLHHLHPGNTLPAALQSALDDDDDQRILTTAAAFAAQATADPQVAAVATTGVQLAARALIRALLLSHSTLSSHLQPACLLITALCSKNEINRSIFVTNSQHDGVKALATLLQRINSCIHSVEQPLIIATLDAVAAVQRNNEKVKTRFTAACALDYLLCILHHSAIQLSKLPESPQPPSQILAIFTKTSFIFRQFLAPDDTTTNVYDTFNRARVLSGSKVVTDSGIKPATYPETLSQILHSASATALASASLSLQQKQSILIQAMRTIRLCAISDQICADVIQLNFHNLVFDALNDRPTAALAHAALALLANLANRDQCKTLLFDQFHVICQVAQPHIAKSARCAEHYSALLSRLCLRRPDLSRRATAEGYVDVVLDSMRVHVDDVSVQKMACLVIRNVCARDKEARLYVRERTSAESDIRAAWEKFKQIDGDAYAALRDMDVLKVKELRRDERYTMPAGFYNMKVHTAT